jgi:hypothetical protein
MKYLFVYNAGENCSEQKTMKKWAHIKFILLLVCTKRDVCVSKGRALPPNKHKLTTGLPNNVISNNWVSSYIQITTTERSEERESKLAFDPAFVARVLATGG